MKVVDIIDQEEDLGVLAGFLALRTFGQPKGRVPILLGLIGLGLSYCYYV